MQSNGGKKLVWGILASVLVSTMAMFLLSQRASAGTPQDRTDKVQPVHVTPCDGVAGASLDLPSSHDPNNREQALKMARVILAAWMERNPERVEPWKQEEALAMASHPVMGPDQQIKPAASAPEKQPVKFTDRDKLIWNLELKKMVDEGYRLFHSSTALGGTIGISCDMCHPDSSNTHPETYPKFQVQLKKVALLRDMINWCIENPEKGKPLPQDDEKLRAVEAYILSQSKGKALEFGKH
jgi:thiosulfate dehydrogenase